MGIVKAIYLLVRAFFICYLGLTGIVKIMSRCVSLNAR